MKKIHFRVADRIINKTALRYRKWSGKLLYSALVFRHLNRRLGGIFRQEKRRGMHGSSVFFTAAETGECSR